MINSAVTLYEEIWCQPLLWVKVMEKDFFQVW